ncbi:unnamed protein product, partial [Nezara viridula]
MRKIVCCFPSEILRKLQINDHDPLTIQRTLPSYRFSLILRHLRGWSPCEGSVSGSLVPGGRPGLVIFKETADGERSSDSV